MNNNARSCLWDFQWLNLVITHNVWFFIFSLQLPGILTSQIDQSRVWPDWCKSLLSQNQNACQYFYEKLLWSRKGVPIYSPPLSLLSPTAPSDFKPCTSLSQLSSKPGGSTSISIQFLELTSLRTCLGNHLIPPPPTNINFTLLFQGPLWQTPP